MRVVLQRVSRASVRVEGRTVGEIGAGLLLLCAFAEGDGETELRWMADKCVQLRVFPDEDYKLNRSVAEVGGALLAVSQFTLYGDCRKGRRPSFTRSAPPARAEELYARFVAVLRESGLPVATGVFQAMMEVELVNAGPVTLVLEREAAEREGGTP